MSEQIAPRRIALVGTSGSGISAPIQDPSWEIWGVGARAAFITRATRWFELHRLDGEPPAWAAQWRDEMKKWSHDCELVMLWPEDLGPKVLQFEFERLIKRFGSSYFMTSSFAWMMADAIDQMVPAGQMAPAGSEIGLWGVDMEYGTEYRHQRTGLRHFIDLAFVLGIKVTRLSSGGMASEPVPYPFWQDDPLLCKLAVRRQTIQKRMADWRQLLTRTGEMIAQQHAVIAEIDLSQKDDYDPAARKASAERTLASMQAEAKRLQHDLAYAQGCDEEQAWLEDYLKP